MAKKRFRSRGSGGRSSGSGGYGGGYYQGANGQGGGQRRRRRYRDQNGGGYGGGGYQNRDRQFGGDLAPPPEDGSAPPGDGQMVEGQAQPGLDGAVPPAVEVPLEPGYGMLEMHPNGYGFLRSPDNNYTRERSDPFVPGTMIERYGLRQGLMIRGTVQPARRQQGPRVREITDVDGMPPDDYRNVKYFDAKTPVNPNKWFRLETGPQPMTTRVMDLLTPLGRGQRALIVSPPRAGKTIMLQHISQSMTANFPDVKQFILLIDERPEEVTDMRRNVQGEVCASSLDNDIESHVRLSQLVIERCKRLAEMGQDVFVLLDSITRLARAFNKWVGDKGGTMTGGLNIKAMDIPKKLFATARAFEEGGSLTIVGTALVETNSRMDDAIFQEFKGTGNMELVLDRKLAERRVWPAIDVTQSGTRREELLLPPDALHAVTMLRRTLSSMHPVDAMEQLTKQLGRFKTNAEFIKLISSARLD
jgi:transcription termination factor Rho